MDIQEIKKTRRSLFLTGNVLLLLLGPGIALAYVGPGAGLGAIGTVLALIGAVLLGIVGFIWYPVKRLLGGKKKERPDESAAPDDPGADSTVTAQQTEGKPRNI